MSKKINISIYNCLYLNPILISDITFPDHISDKEFKKFLMLMLSKNPLSRLSKISHIKNNPWLKNFVWDNLISLDMQAPYIPKLNIIEEDSSKIPYVSYIKVICFCCFIFIFI